MCQLINLKIVTEKSQICDFLNINVLNGAKEKAEDY